MQEGILTVPTNKYSLDYFSTKKDLQNLAHRAITKRRHSLFDQDALNKFKRNEELLYSLQKYSQSNESAEDRVYDR